MPSFQISPDDKIVHSELEETILQASLKAGIPHAHACGGFAKCSTCRVVVETGSELLSKPGEAEKKLANKVKFPKNVRLACQTRIKGDGKLILKRPVIDDIDLELTNIMGKNSLELQKMGEPKKLAIMFVDIEGYTPFAEALPSYDIMHVLNKYFYLMGKVINKKRGNIIDYYGDGLLAIFGLYESTPEEAALLAVEAGIEMNKELLKLNPYLEKMYCKSFKIRIGINYGNVITGTIGIEGMQKFSVIGDPVNMASRIETTNKLFGTHFLISESVKALLPEKVKLGKTCETVLKGKKGNHRLYEVLIPETNA
ncbi:adenylate/guanylate cyclase domain-containing protein [Chondrinema litorale]|uniref:adenylate/guanylate cyclase domain-containing protein n=1 Tax=Chondrinema litorale TaxID=2994555 RepID=UPI0025438222|nr:adenylate/guanylate cyclase domain-containing protein [Chondrinema litorale]UZR95516.1 adenylate/guanylate cyclase domain-containing protein [Chondrinema litorale]